MQADEQHAAVVPEDLLRAVAVVHVKINHRHAGQAVRVQRVRRSDGDVVEHAVATTHLALCMVPRRPASQHALWLLHAANAASTTSTTATTACMRSRPHHCLHARNMRAQMQAQVHNVRAHTCAL